MKMKEYILLPAYGRAYSDVASTIKDWEAGKDFKIYGMGYCSIRDLESMKKDVDKIVFVVHNSKLDKVIRFNYWIHPLAGLTHYVE
jgi:hypothetical protein